MVIRKKPLARAARKGRGGIQGGVNSVDNTPEAPDAQNARYAEVFGASALEPKPDTDATLSFLLRFAPEGPWGLTAISERKNGGGKRLDGLKFDKNEFEGMGKWIKERNGKANLYFHVNPVMHQYEQKAKRDNIKSMDWLHVDIDARADNPDATDEEKAQTLQDEFTRILDLLTNKLPAGTPAPSVITYSGGGFQAFWKLEEPVPINGEEAAYEDAKLYNVQLEAVFDGDNCHNLDRIMRLPGTINIPDAKKLKKGRKPALAKVVKFADDIAYKLSSFIKASPIQLPNEAVMGAGGGTQTEAIKLPGNIERISDLKELDKWNVPDRVKVILVQGRHPEEEKEDNSRSAWLFDALCQLYRAGVPDEVVFSLITDKDYGISASVLDKGTNVQKYALRQMGRAKGEIIQPWLRKLNTEHFIVLNDGGKCRVMEEIADPAFQNRLRLTRQSFADFRNRYMNKTVGIGGDKSMPVGLWWLCHPQRREYRTIVFAPGKTIPADAYNLWQGFAYESRPGDRHLSFLKHIHENVCQRNDGHYSYLVGWMARAVQFPGEQGHVAVVLRGEKGVGKGVLAKHFGKLFGRHFLHISNSSHLVGHFNSHLRDCVVLFADEAFYAGEKKHDGILKTIVTEDMLTIEVKGQDVVQSPNFLHLIMSTNEDHAVQATGDERRYFIQDVGKARQQNSEYFGAIASDLENGGYENLLHFLQRYDLTGYDVRAVPKTAGLREQQAHTRPSWESAIIAMAEEGVSPDHDGWKSYGPGWVSAWGILEHAGEDGEDRRLQMQVTKKLRPLLVMEVDGGDAKPKGRVVKVECLCEEGRSPIPIAKNEDHPSLRVREVQRRIYELLPLPEFRAALDAAGMSGDWNLSVQSWQPRRDKGWAIDEAKAGRPPF